MRIARGTTMTYEKLKLALMAGCDVSFTFEPHLSLLTQKEAKKLVVTGRRCIESYMIYQSDDDIECIAFSTHHLTVANDVRPVLEISKYVIRNTDTPEVKLTSYFLSPHEYSFLRDPLTFEGQVGTSFKFIVSNRAP